MAPKPPKPPGRIPQADWPRWSAGFRELVETRQTILDCAHDWAAAKHAGTDRRRAAVLRRARTLMRRLEELTEQLRPPEPDDPHWHGLRKRR